MISPQCGKFCRKKITKTCTIKEPLHSNIVFTVVLWFYVQSGWSLILQLTRRVQWVKKKTAIMQKLVLSYLCYNTVYPGFFACHKICKNWKMCSILICVGHFCDLKGFLLKIIQNLISAHSIICDLKELAKISRYTVVLSLAFLIRKLNWYVARYTVRY